MATLVGKKLGARRGARDDRGLTIEDTYFVRNAANVVDALLCPGLPQYGAAAVEDPSLIVRRFDPEELTESGTFAIRVTWMPPAGSITSDNGVQRVDWNHSLTQQNVTVDLDRKQIGNRYFIRIGLQGIIRTPFMHDNAKIGTDVQIPLLQAEIRMPIPSTYNPLTVNSLIGRANNASLMIDGFTWPAGSVILLGCRAVRTEPRPQNAFELSYLVAIGESELPLGVPRAFASNGDTYSPETIPLEYGYSVEYSAYDKDGELALTETNIHEARPVYVWIHRLYRRRNLGQLGWT